MRTFFWMFFDFYFCILKRCLPNCAWCSWFWWLWKWRQTRDLWRRTNVIGWYLQEWKINSVKVSSYWIIQPSSCFDLIITYYLSIYWHLFIRNQAVLVFLRYWNWADLLNEETPSSRQLPLLLRMAMTTLEATAITAAGEKENVSVISMYNLRPRHREPFFTFSTLDEKLLNLDLQHWMTSWFYL